MSDENVQVTVDMLMSMALAHQAEAIRIVREVQKKMHKELRKTNKKLETALARARPREEPLVVEARKAAKLVRKTKGRR